MRYRAQYNPLYIILSVLLFIIVIVDCMTGSTFSIIMTILCAVLLWISLLREYYIIEQRLLLIRRGLINLTVSVDEIKRLNIVQIKERIGVEVVLVNRIITVYPVETVFFVEHLCRINPEIDIENGNMMSESITVR